MGSFSIGHWLIVLLIVALVFGTKKLRNIGSDLGAALKNFKNGMREAEHPAATRKEPPYIEIEAKDKMRARDLSDVPRDLH